MKSKEYLGALDAGTTGVRFVIVDKTGLPVAAAYREISLRFPRPGWVEQDPAEIKQKTIEVIQDALKEADIKPYQLVGFGLTNQRETVLIWDSMTGKHLTPAIVWQDRRTADRCSQLRAELSFSKEIREKTGLIPDPYFSATKLEWLFRNYPDLHRKASSGQALIGTVDSWLLFSLTGVHATDYTNASRTMLFDIQRKEWDENICQFFAVPKKALPQVGPSVSLFGYTKRDIFGTEIPVAGILGDQQAALFGQACLETGEGKVTWGTGAFLLVNVGEGVPVPPEGVLVTIAYTTEKITQYALEGSIFVAGAAVQWLRDGLGIIKNSAETEELAKSLSDNEGVYFVPALAGLGAPYWDPYARGVIVGLTRGTTRAHLARAALEAIAYQTYDLVQLFESVLPWSISELRVDGGAAQNDFLCQFQADILARPIVRPRFLETTTLGAAFACGCALGIWDFSDIKSIWQAERYFMPTMLEAQRLKFILGWERAVERARDWVKED